MTFNIGGQDFKLEVLNLRKKFCPPKHVPNHYPEYNPPKKKDSEDDLKDEGKVKKIFLRLNHLN